MTINQITLGDLREPNAAQVSLSHGHTRNPVWSSELTARFQTLARAHVGPDASGAMVLNVPGRIEVLGKHTDYAGGPSLTCASNLSMAAVVTVRAELFLLVVDEARGIQVEFSYENPLPVDGQSWTIYVCAVLRRLIRHFGAPERGVSIVLSSQLPSASGMSSSSGLIITIALSLLGMGQFAHIPPKYRTMSRERFAGFAGALESGADFEDLKGDKGVGTKGGSEDHTAILCSSPNAFNWYTYFPVQRVGSVSIPETVSLVVASSGVVARKTGEAKDSYNLASRRARRVVHMWNELASSSVLNMGDMIAHPSFDRINLQRAIESQEDSTPLWNRFAQFDLECNFIIPGAIEALRTSQWTSFGRFIDESQKMAHEWLGNQVPETNDLVRMARDLGAYGASAFGAGFGGAVWAIVETAEKESFREQWMAAYTERYPARMSLARFFQDSPSPGALMIGAKSFQFDDSDDTSPE